MAKSTTLKPMIPGLEKFKKSLELHLHTIIVETDPIYCEKIVEHSESYLKTGLKNIEGLKNYAQILNTKYKRLGLLLGSLYEVKRGWERLMDIYSLFETEPPMTENQRINEEKWWRLCNDLYWFADYGYSEKLLTFLKKFQRIIFREKNSLYTKIIEDSKKKFVDLHEVTKTIRDPLAHTQSFFTDQELIDIFWQLYLPLGCEIDFTFDPLDVLDSIIFLDKKTQIKAIYSWFKYKYEITNKIFTQLNKIPLQNLKLVLKEHKS